MRITKATMATIVTLLESLTTVILTFVLFKEHLSATALLGAALVIVAMVVLARK